MAATFVSAWAAFPAETAPAPPRAPYRPGKARVGEPTPQSNPALFTDAEILAEFRYLGRLNGRPAASVPEHPGQPGGQTFLRSCAGCSAHLACNDPSSEKVWCPKCRARYVQPFDRWAAALKPGDRVYVRPYAAWRGLSHSEYLITARDGDTLTVQVLGIPESSMPISVRQCGQHDLTPRI